jgi:ribosomal protein S10
MTDCDAKMVIARNQAINASSMEALRIHRRIGAYMTGKWPKPTARLVAGMVKSPGNR